MSDLVFRTQYLGSKVTHDLMRWWTKVRPISNWRMGGEEDEEEEEQAKEHLGLV